MEDIDDVADFGDTAGGSSDSSEGSQIAELASNATIAELRSELRVAYREQMVMEHNLLNARESLRVAQASLYQYSCAGALTGFMAIMKTNINSWYIIMGPPLVSHLKDLNKLLSGTSTKKLRLMMKTIVKNVKSGENEQLISYKRGGAWPIGVKRLPFKELSKRNQVALVAWLYICPDHPLLDVTRFHLQQVKLRNTFKVRVLHCVQSIREAFDPENWCLSE